MSSNRLPDSKPKYITHHIEDKEVNTKTIPVRIEKKESNPLLQKESERDYKTLQETNLLLQGQLVNSIKLQEEQVAIIAVKNIALQVKNNEDYLIKSLTIMKLIAKPFVRRKELEILGAEISNFWMTAKICGITFYKRLYKDEYCVQQGLK